MPYSILECNYNRPERITHTVIKNNDITLPSCSKLTVPGDSTERSCAFHGCRVVIADPVKNVVHIVHSTESCAYYSWRYRVQSKGDCITTALTEKDVVMGSGVDKLYKTIIEVGRKFKPEGIFVYETCVPALIGDDIKAVCKKCEEILNIPVISFKSAGFRGITQNAGHKIAIDHIFPLIGTKEFKNKSPYDINIIGDFTHRDAEKIENILKNFGINTICSFTGNATLEKIRMMGNAKLNIVYCIKSSVKLAKMMEKKFKIPYIPVNFFGIDNFANSLRNIGNELNINSDIIEKYIHSEIEKIKPKLEYYKKQLKGKRVFLCHGAQRVLNYMGPLMDDLGMEIIGVSTYFGNNENYLKIMEKLPNGAIVLDNPTSDELEEVIKTYKPDIFISDDRTRQLIYKLGMPFLFGRGKGRSYIGFDGFINFAEDIYGTMKPKAWKLINSGEIYDSRE